ncbi:hypothetical protein PBI_LAUER_46 [Gordonia phage Lauer]|uniref:Uncharacterized protein n=1 Tax=Gordonia phage Lauer TaxID=2656538 RepID=A0A649VIX3_9CAUD|nr:hypothetical protein PP995_gp46 [Gordonia phage Lauer]QGJ92154.1 hypothetical protein PBI_LAUER_46 [Gordonia phage Lauer]
MVHYLNAPTMHELHDKLASSIQYRATEKFDLVTSMDCVLEHVYAEADSMVFDYDLRRVWVPPSRWTMMVRQYLDPEEVTAWLALIEKRIVRKKKAGRPILRTRTVQPRTGGKGTVRNLGSCMLTASFTMDPRPTLTLHSRACYVGYLSPLDMGVAYHLARLACNVVGIPLESCRFVWFIETAQMHKFRTIAFVIGDETECDRFLRRPHSDQYLQQKRSRYHYDLWTQWNDEGLLYEEMPKFVSYQRLRKRWNTEMFGYEYAKQFETPANRAFRPLPSVPINSLTFEKIEVE